MTTVDLVFSALTSDFCELINSTFSINLDLQVYCLFLDSKKLFGLIIDHPNFESLLISNKICYFIYHQQTTSEFNTLIHRLRSKYQEILLVFCILVNNPEILDIINQNTDKITVMLFNLQTLRGYCLEGKKPCLLDSDENLAKAAEFKEFRAKIPVEDEKVGGMVAGMVTGSVDKPLDYNSFVERLCELSSIHERNNIQSQDSNIASIQPMDTMKTINGTSKPSNASLADTIATNYLQGSTIASTSSNIVDTTHSNVGSRALSSTNSIDKVPSHPIDPAATSATSAVATAAETVKPTAGSSARKVLTFKKSGLTENAEIQNFFQSLLNKKKSEI